MTTSDTSPPATAERRARLAELGACRRDDEQRHARAPLHRCSVRSSKQRLGPVQIVEHQDHRLGRGERGEKPSHREERLLRRDRRADEERRDPVDDAPLLVLLAGHVSPERRPERVRARGIVEAEKVRSASASGANVVPPVALSRAVKTVAAVAEPASELVDQARLPEPRRAEQDREPARRRRDRRLVDRRQPPQLLLASDERRRRRPAGRSSDSTR